jgi:phosphonate metabolism protein PhnN/1,5-bisphosphokinase (PRPP-forming)
MKGCWVLVCGPSGAGKDSVLTWAQRALREHPRICFARRLVTRPAAPGSDHDPVNLMDMAELRRTGGLAWTWQAHGYEYGVRTEYAQRVRSGELVVVNGSREHASSLARGPELRCVLVTASPGVLRARLDARGRDEGQAISRRMARNTELPAPFADHVIVNDHALEQAGAAMRDYLLELAP